MTLAQILQGWKQFWFELRSPLPVALFRILYGLHVLVFALLLFPDLKVWYLPSGMLSLQPYREWLITDRFSLLFWLPANEWSLYAVFVVLVLSAVTLTIGFCTRTSCVVLVLMLISLHQRNLIILNSGDGLMRLMGIYLMFSHAGKAAAVDQWLRKRAGAPPPQQGYSIWAQRLMQLQICAVYLHSVLAKINGDTWLDGTAVYYALQLRDFYRFPVLFLLKNILLLKLLTWGTLIIETCMFTLIWLKEVRYYVLAGAVALHLGIEITMNIPLFETLMISSLVVFVDPVDLQRVIDKLKLLLHKRASAALPFSSSNAA